MIKPKLYSKFIASAPQDYNLSERLTDQTAKLLLVKIGAALFYDFTDPGFSGNSGASHFKRIIEIDDFIVFTENDIGVRNDITNLLQSNGNDA